MPSQIPDGILSRFAPWANCDCWVMCDKDKHPVTIHNGDYLIPTERHPAVPHHYGFGQYLRWKDEPQDHITTLAKVQSVVDKFMFGTYGFGMILGLNNAVVCFDFDHVINKDGSVNPNVEGFLSVLNTFCEVSSSGTGIHAFVAVDGSTQEYDYRKEFCDGKCYDKRFIKMTGNIFRDYDLPIKIIDETDFVAIRNKTGVKETLSCSPQKTHLSICTDGSDWGKTLSSVGIRYEVIREYKDTERKHGDVIRTSVWAARVQCPNAEHHTGYSSRRTQFNPDVAILTLWDDGTTSLKCNHNSCSWIHKPNLLLKLWAEIKSRRVVTPGNIYFERDQSRLKLKEMGVL
jgi:hypothetical protein